MIVIVTGMHRSGTSAMAGVLNDNGIHMGDKHTWHPPPMKENPKGFFENKLFRVVNDQLLRENGYHVKAFDKAVPDPDRMNISESVQGQMTKLLLDYSADHGNWGFKDPRTCLTLRFWLATADVLGLKYKVILMYRNNLDIALSMKARGNKPGLGHLATVAGAYYKAVKRHHHDFIEVQYINLMYHTDEILNAVDLVLGIPLPVHSHIDPTIADRVCKVSPATDAMLADAAMRKDSYVNRC